MCHCGAAILRSRAAVPNRRRRVLDGTEDGSGATADGAWGEAYEHVASRAPSWFYLKQGRPEVAAHIIPYYTILGGSVAQGRVQGRFKLTQCSRYGSGLLG